MPSTKLQPTPDVDAPAVRDAVLRSEHVAGLHAGEHGELATYLPGERVLGVQVRDDVVIIHVVSRWGSSASALFDDVRRRVADLADGRRIDVVVGDVQLPGEPDDEGGTDDVPEA